MPTRTSSALWEGNLRDGSGTMKLGSGAFEGSYSFVSRFESGPGTNPEELIAAAHAGCFSMALSLELGQSGFTPTSIATSATVHLDRVADGFGITKIDLDTVATVPGIDDAKFQEVAAAAKAGCPVSKVLAGAEITLSARLA
ncbi:MAG TPA: OsmC family protein [Micromonosporaceae bacterium]|jgi:osmotically inducible protein OsmC